MKRNIVCFLALTWISFEALAQDERSRELKKKMDILKARMEINPSQELSLEYNKLQSELNQPAKKTKKEKIVKADVAAPGEQKNERLQEKYNNLEKRLSLLEAEEKKPLIQTAQAPNNYSVRGHFQYRLEGAKNTKGVDAAKQEDQSFFRFRTYLTYGPRPNVDFNLTPQATKGFGANENSQSTSGSTVHTSIFFFEANINYKLSDSLAMKLGRQEVAYGDHLVIGSLPWDNAGRSFDALKFNLKHKNGWTDFMYSRTDNNNTALESTDDVNLAVIYNSWSFNDYLKTTDLYLINQNDQRVNGVEVNMVGMRIKGNAGPVFYRTENGVQNGRGLDGDAFQANLEAGAVYNSMKLSLEYSLAGDDYQQLYPTAHKFLGYADVLGRRNIEHYAIHFVTDITTGLSLNIDQHFFSRHNSGRSAYKLNGATPWGTTGTSKDIGDELDVLLNYKTKDLVNLQLGAAFFNPGKYMEEQIESKGKQTRFVYAQINSEF